MKTFKITEKEKGYLTYEDNWDGEGSKGYKEKTLIRVHILLYNCNKFLSDRFEYNIIDSEILPGPDGSFDVFWKTNNYELLVNVPEDKDAPITYYGEEKDGTNPIKGEFKTCFSETLFLWLYMRSKKFKE